MSWFVIIALCIVSVIFKYIGNGKDSASASSKSTQSRPLEQDSARQQSNNESSPYFSYENGSNRSGVHVGLSNKTEVVADDPLCDFDLRQAVIYDTILTNPYIAER